METKGDTMNIEFTTLIRDIHVTIKAYVSADESGYDVGEVYVFLDGTDITRLIENDRKLNDQIDEQIIEYYTGG